MRQLTIGIDARISRDWRTGVGRFSIELLAAMAPRRPQHQFLVLTKPGAPQVPIEAPNVEQKTIDCEVASVRQAIRYGRCTRHLGIDVFFFTHPLTAPIIDPGPAIGLIHDVYPLLFPADYPRAVSLYYRSIVRLAESRKTAVFAVSETSRKDAIRHLRLSPARVGVIHNGVSSQFHPQDHKQSLIHRLGALGLEPGYVLYVGNFRPHKNIPCLLEAIALVAARNSAASLVIAGGVESGERGMTRESVARLAGKLGIEDRVRQVGIVSDETLVDLYNGAAVVAIPSLYEGFGLPALEAMACGAVVVASDAGALKEVVGTAGILVDPRNPVAIASALYSVLADSALRQSLREASLKRAREFSWQAAADRLLARLESVAT